MSLLNCNTKHRSSVGGVIQTVKLFEDMSGTNGGTQSGTLSGVTAGSTIAVFFGNHSPTLTPACSDGQGSYTIHGNTGNNPAAVRSFHLTNANAGTHTISITNTQTFYIAYAVEISAASSNSFDVGAAQFQATGTNTGTDGITSGNFTTTQGNDLILGFCFQGGGSPASVGSGYTSLASDTGGGQFCSRLEWKTAVAAGTFAATCSAASSYTATAGMAFKHP